MTIWKTTGFMLAAAIRPPRRTVKGGACAFGRIRGRLLGRTGATTAPAAMLE